MYLQQESYLSNTYFEQHGDELFIVNITISVLISQDHHLLSLHRSQFVAKSLQDTSQVWAKTNLFFINQLGKRE